MFSFHYYNNVATYISDKFTMDNQPYPPHYCFQHQGLNQGLKNARQMLFHGMTSLAPHELFLIWIFAVTLDVSFPELSF